MECVLCLKFLFLGLGFRLKFKHPSFFRLGIWVLEWDCEVANCFGVIRVSDYYGLVHNGYLWVGLEYMVVVSLKVCIVEIL